jgi:hypothetical protein
MVGARFAREAPRDTQRAIIACEVARKHMATPSRRRVEQAGRWAATAIRAGIIILTAGLLLGSPAVTFAGAVTLIAGGMGLHQRVSGAQAVRDRVHAADELAASWVGRDTVVHGLQWQLEHSLPERLRRASRFSPPTVQDRLAHLAPGA